MRAIRQYVIAATLNMSEVALQAPVGTAAQVALVPGAFGVRPHWLCNAPRPRIDQVYVARALFRGRHQDQLHAAGLASSCPRYSIPRPFLVSSVNERAVYGRNSASLVVKATFDIAPGAPATPAKNQKPFADDTPFMDPLGRSLAWPDDLVPWKPHTDVFIVGAYHQPGGVAAPEGRCAFRFGPLAKELRIHGPRLARRAAAPPGEKPGPWSIMPAEPVAMVPLRWELSLGGLRDPNNPYGLGGDIEAQDGIETLRLPLIVNPAAPDRPDNLAPVPPCSGSAGASSARATSAGRCSARRSRPRISTPAM